MAKDSIEESQSELQKSKAGVEAIPVKTAGIAETGPAPVSVAILEDTAGETVPGDRRHIVKSATLVMLGNLCSSLIGMIRQQVVASLGSSIGAPFTSAISPAHTFNDFLINGSINGALIPTFNDYAAAEKRDELRRLVFTMVNLVFIIMLVAAIVFLLISAWFVPNIQVRGYTVQQKLLTIQYARIIFFSLLALGPFAVLQAALFARKEFGLPAVATAAYHIGIILGAIVGSILGEHYLGYLGIAFGVLVGAVGEIALLIPGMRNQRLKYMLVLDLKHPALRRILKLYAPVAASFLVSMGLVFLDQHLASATPCAAFVHQVKACGEANFTAMRAATTLIQFPIGLVAAALSFAVLPTLAAHVREGNDEQFKETLLLGIR